MPVPADNEDRATISCSRCQACCCQLKVLVMVDDDVPQWLLTHDAHGMEVMRRHDDGWCAALDRDSLRCTIHARRPQVCRDFAMGGGDCRDERERWRRVAASL
ncbi:YkgJ family cysteine cluster protein [Metallibacterium scheffleri]|jgi:Fe-S-cluster containining protein|uniref:Zinc/iron-chelating domain-containing protein n=1 Tax=Metallibacterium scheffleri TaxID=993689 RepID=A0A4S3KFE7_9GAMM|nr:YkgJ family cysteine cluster protein [Metallibacterium scheffleri]THD07322.1 zinc/iron-chelating domain-containing protein [Metallibacterium scheffleri]